MAKAKKLDMLDPAELEVASKEPFYQSGHPYLWVLSYGWCVVGFYVRHETPLRIRIAHGNYYLRAGKSHAELAMEGSGPQTDWRYSSDECITEPHVIHVMIYRGEVPRGPVKPR